MNARIYVACLASYNNGILYGRWIDASTDIDEMQAEIAEMLRGSPYPNVMRAEYENEYGERHISSGTNGEFKLSYVSANGETWNMVGEPFPSAEEYAIHDYEGLGADLGEYAGLGEVARRVAVAEAAEDAGIPVAVVMEAMDNYSDDAADFISERYRGAYDTWEDMAAELLDETGELSEIPERLRNYFDYAAYGRDLRLGGDLSAYRDDETGNLHFFWNH